MKVKVKTEGLEKSFGDNHVLKGIDIEITEGEVVCVIGPSGSGKSTFLRCLNKLEEASAGKIIIDDYDITDKKTNINKVRENIGMVFQHFNLFNNLNVLKNLMLAPVDLKKADKERYRRDLGFEFGWGLQHSDAFQGIFEDLINQQFEVAVGIILFQVFDN